MGYVSCGLVASGEEALEKAASERPDVVLMDIRLRGEMSGLQAADGIARQFSIPVIYLTAYADEGVLQQAKVTHPYGYLTKPVRDKELRASIEVALFRSETDRRMRQVNAVLRSIRGVDQLLTRERDRQRLLQEACRILVQTRGYLLVWMAGPEPAPGGLCVLAAAGLTEDLVAPGGMVSRADLPESAPTWVALLQRAPVVGSSPSTADTPCPWEQKAVARGCVSKAAVPMVCGDSFLGVLTVCADRVAAFDDDEVALLEELAADLAFALHHIESEDRRLRAERELRQAHDELERRVEDRTRELRQANSELRAEIDARGRAERTLADREAQLRALLDNIPDLAWLKNTESVYLAANQALSVALGRPIDQIVGHPDADLSPPDLAAQRRDDDLGVMGSGQARRAIESRASPDGEPVWVETIKSPVRNERGEIIGTAGVARDISELKRAEQRILDSLEKERQLNEMKTRFIATASHEFRTPMTVAAGFAEMLRNQFDRLSEEKRRVLLDRILDAVWRVTQMLEDVLILNRADQGRTAFKPVQLSLSSLIRDLIEEVRSADEDHHAFLFDAGESTGEGYADESLLRPVLSNVLTNAARYSAPEKPVRVRLDCLEGQAIIEIEDQGIGIPAEDQPRVFLPFERGRNVGKIRGSGMGLSVAQRLVGLHQGTITFTSQLGTGSTFTIRVPIAPAPAAGPAA